MRIIECVPNISEGRDKSIINSVAESVRNVNGVKLLDVDSGEATNRTVFTFVGEAYLVCEAAFRLIETATKLIDMKNQKGEHSRIGATDVCPLIPISGISIEECIQLSKKLAERVGNELGIPIYLYEHAATSPQRKNLADIRKGEYEGLSEKIKLPEWKPDYGPIIFNSKSGATVIGVRDFLIAYNVNLNTTDQKLANEIAFRIREQGRAKRDSDGNILRSVNGESIKIPGTLKNVKAVGWFIKEYNQAQISINLTNFKITPPHVAFEECVKEANSLGLRVTGSEIIGLIPKEAMLIAGRYFLEKQGKSPGLPEKNLIEIAIQSLGLSDISLFEPNKKIIENVLEENVNSLNNLTVRQFVDELSTDSPAPGGGSAAALSGSIAAGLVAMVANLTVGKKGYESVFDEMKNISISAQKLKDELLLLVDEDTNAFNKLMEAVRLPKKSEEEINKRNKLIEETTLYASEVPLRTMEKSFEVLSLAKIVSEKGNKNSNSDAGVAILLSRSAIKGGAMNVEINLKELQESEQKKSIQNKMENILQKTN
ncbi:MAG: glutamate formimidoyltransferase [Ignavibacteria bacterium]|nr:glutamate formimidoyltransferase [Ignavibacteria bacterium]